MYSVSNDYRTKMFDQVQTHRLSGTIDTTHSFTESDVIGVSYTGQCSDKKVNIGAVFIGMLKLTFTSDILNRGSYDKKPITISDGLLLGYDENDDPIWEDVPIGTFYVGDAVWRAEGMIDITAYDCLSLMDLPCQIDTSFGTVYSFCKYIETMTGAEFGMTEAQCLALPNGSESILPSVDNDINTYRDLLSYLAAFVGGFAYAGKDGKFYIKTYNNTSVLSIPKNRRISKASYSDYTTFYDAISYTDIRTGVDKVIGDDLGTIMNLGPNPFLQSYNLDVQERRLNNILNAIAPMRYTPFAVSLLPAFIALDLSDVVSFPDDYAEETTSGAVMSLSWTYNKSVQIKCFGDNPNIGDVQSQANKRISALRQTTSQNEMTYYDYANTEALTFGSETEVKIATFRFIAAQMTSVLIFHEFIFDMVNDPDVAGSYEIRYYLNGELVPYSPEEALGALVAKTNVGGTNYTAGFDPVAFTITRDFFYHLKGIQAGVFNTWEVAIVTHGITSTTIDINHVHIALEGQRLYAEEYFGGLLVVEDTLNLIDIGYIDTLAMADDAKVTEEYVADFLITDNDEIFITDDGDGIILDD